MAQRAHPVLDSGDFFHSASRSPTTFCAVGHCSAAPAAICRLMTEFLPEKHRLVTATRLENHRLVTGSSNICRTP
jgi:hypothetical protein